MQELESKHSKFDPFDENGIINILPAKQKTSRVYYELRIYCYMSDYNTFIVVSHGQSVDS